ncbi:MAG: ABC transporter substrate binding protein [Burkholderiales bacterium]
MSRPARTASVAWRAAWRLLVVAALLLPLAAGARNEPYRVLLLHSFRTALPINASFTAGISKGLAASAMGGVEIDSESLDLSRFDDEVYVGKLKEVFRLKYRERRPDLIVPTYTPALQFLLEHGEELFPGVPIVFCASDVEYATARRLPPNVTGVTVKRDFAHTMDVMLHIDPDLRHVALVVGAGNLDRSWEATARADLAPYAGRVEFTWMRGLPMPELARRLQALPPNSAVLYIVQFADANGTPYVPRAVAGAAAEAASAPVYGTWDTLLGSGILGGWLATIEDAGVTAGTMAARVLAGTAPAAIPVANSEGTPTFDGRQLARWNIAESRLPPGSRVLFTEHSLWREHPVAVVATIVVVVLQAALIVALLVNRLRLRGARASLQQEYEQRSRAEDVSAALRTRLANFSKQSALGALATGIAHEVNQPLAAIKNYAQAAKRYVARDTPDREKITALISEMEGEAARAGGIIQKIRAVVRTGEVQSEPCSLPAAVRVVLREIATEEPAAADRIAAQIDRDLPPVLADPLQLQVVLVNLLHNALESAGPGGPPAGSAITVLAKRAGDADVEIRVVDDGPGISPETAESIFDPLFSTKPTGMGVGLATCKTIVEAHGGRIWYTPNPDGGSVFHFTLPVAGA